MNLPVDLLHLSEPEAGALAPGRHVVQNPGIVPHDLQALAGLQMSYLPGRQDDGDRAERPGDVEPTPSESSLLPLTHTRGRDGKEEFTYNRRGMMRRLPLTVLVLSIALPAATPPTHAWTPKSQLAIAREAAKLAPPDLYRQILKHKEAYEAGVLAPFDDGDANRHQKDADGRGSLDKIIAQEGERAVNAIWTHHSFREIVYQLGIVSHYASDANNPLNTSSDDPSEGRYYADYLLYMEGVAPRLQVVFYGLEPALEENGDIGFFASQIIERARTLYPFIGMEYRRIGRVPARDSFDDRSTAFGVAAVSFSRAISDVALMLRYIWIRAGGADERPAPRSDEGRLLLLPPLLEGW